MAMKTLDDLFTHLLRDIYFAERQGVKEMRGMARKASAENLKKVIEEHRTETEQQVEMLGEVFEKMGMRPRGTRCEAIMGIAEEAHEIMEEAEDDQTRDAGIVAAIQAIEHYEISRYGTAIAWARRLGHDDVIPILEQIRDQEVAADEKLTEIAESEVNEAAMGGKADAAGEGGGEEAGRSSGAGGRKGGAESKSGGEGKSGGGAKSGSGGGKSGGAKGGKSS